MRTNNDALIAAKVSDHAERLLRLISLGRDSALALEAQIDSDANIERTNSQQHWSGVFDSLLRHHKSSLAGSLGKLYVPDVPSQSEWTSPSFQIYSQTVTGGIETPALRLGSVAVNAHGHR